MKLLDQGRSYGWISIVLHWVGAAVIVQMLYLGSSSPSWTRDSGVPVGVAWPRRQLGVSDIAARQAAAARLDASAVA